MTQRQRPLSQISFSILMALSLKPRHGYEIMQQVSEDSAGRIKIGPAALYTNIKQLCAEGRIEESSTPDDTRRRHYKLSASGWNALNAELEYYDSMLKVARSRNAYEGMQWKLV
jgi:DNA-binding PadR family transcriptional regulator